MGTEIKRICPGWPLNLPAGGPGFPIWVYITEKRVSVQGPVADTWPNIGGGQAYCFGWMTSHISIVLEQKNSLPKYWGGTIAPLPPPPQVSATAKTVNKRMRWFMERRSGGVARDLTILLLLVCKTVSKIDGSPWLRPFICLSIVRHRFCV